MPDNALDNVKVEQLDQAIRAMLAGGSPEAGSGLAALVEIAASLLDLPDESFQKRLKSDLKRRATMPASTTVSATQSTFTATPFIAVENAPRLIEFLRRTFGAEETARHPHGDGFVASLRIGSSDVLVMGGESVAGEEHIGAFHVFVPDCDATYNRAIEAGGTSMGEPADRPYGERSGFVKDAAGNYWYIATRLPGPIYIEGLGTVTPYLHPLSVSKFIDFAKQAFGAEEIARYEHGGRVMHAAARIGSTILEMGEPHEPDPLSNAFYLHVDDCDALYQRAIAAGATSLWPPTNQAYGERTAGLVDPFGYQWIPATHIKNVG